MSAINAAIALVDALCEQLQLPESRLESVSDGKSSSARHKAIAQAPAAGEAEEKTTSALLNVFDVIHPPQHMAAKPLHVALILYQPVLAHKLTSVHNWRVSHSLRKSSGSCSSCVTCFAMSIHIYGQVVAD